MKKILISVFSIAIVGAVAFGATRAFFSDTETSTGNVLAAGAIDLKIDNTSYVTDNTGTLVSSPNTSWDLRDLTVEKFFNFTDLKPGDVGEDTISVHVNDNDAWLCAAARVTDNSDQDCTEPELADDPTCVPETSGANGDLAQQVNFAFWADDGDNVLEEGETPFLNGPISGLGEAGQLALADSTHNVWGIAGALPGGSDRFIGKAWCFGTLTPAPVAQGANDPLVNTGFTCDGSAVNNAAQTDKVVGDLQFYAVQSRNNAGFTCAENYRPTWPTASPTPAPVVDGVISDGEYDGALSMPITNAGGGDVKAKTQGGFLYLAADIITDTTDNRICCGFNDEFGVNLGESPVTDTVFFGLGSTNANGRIFGPTDGLWSNFNPAGHTIMSLFGTGHRVLEWKIPLSAIPGIVNGDTLSIGGATESTDGNTAVYPIGLVWGNNATYGQLLVTP